jgi:hypothetical protein
MRNLLIQLYVPLLLVLLIYLHRDKLFDNNSKVERAKLQHIGYALFKFARAWYEYIRKQAIPEPSALVADAEKNLKSDSLGNIVSDVKVLVALLFIDQGVIITNNFLFDVPGEVISRYLNWN